MSCPQMECFLSTWRKTFTCDGIMWQFSLLTLFLVYVVKTFLSKKTVIYITTFSIVPSLHPRSKSSSFASTFNLLLNVINHLNNFLHFFVKCEHSKTQTYITLFYFSFVCICCLLRGISFLNLLMCHHPEK